MTGQLKKRNFGLGIDFYLRTIIKKACFKFISDPSHTLHVYYKTKRYYY